MKKIKKSQFRINLKSKHLLAIMTLVCLSLMAGTFASGLAPAPLKELAGSILVPFEKAVSLMGRSLERSFGLLAEKEELVRENEELRGRIDTLTEQNNILIRSAAEANSYKELLGLSEEYADYPKITAHVIAKEPGNWFDTFMIDKGSADGVRVDNNVIAGKGLVGIVTEVGSRWATVRSIIDDASAVSVMSVSSGSTFVVHGSLELIDQGRLRFEQLYDPEGKVTVGDRIVTSNVSEKFMEGIFIGYVDLIEQDSNNLTRTGTIITPIDFSHLEDVFVITENKGDSIREE